MNAVFVVFALCKLLSDSVRRHVLVSLLILIALLFLTAAVITVKSIRRGSRQ